MRRPRRPTKVGPGPQNSPPERKNGSGGGPVTQAPAKGFQRPRRRANGPHPAVLSLEASAILRDRLPAELAGLGCEDGLDGWTLHAWPGTNTLTSADGDKVRDAFQARLASFQAIPHEAPSPTAPDPTPTAHDEPRGRIDKSVLALPEVKRLRDKQHLRFVQPGGLGQADLGKRSATNLRSRSAEHITANCTAPARKMMGGRKWVSSR